MLQSASGSNMYTVIYYTLYRVDIINTFTEQFHIFSTSHWSWQQSRKLASTSFHPGHWVTGSGWKFKCLGCHYPITESQKPALLYSKSVIYIWHSTPRTNHKFNVNNALSVHTLLEAHLYTCILVWHILLVYLYNGHRRWAINRNILGSCVWIFSSVTDMLQGNILSSHPYWWHCP